MFQLRKLRKNYFRRGTRTETMSPPIAGILNLARVVNSLFEFPLLVRRLDVNTEGRCIKSCFQRVSVALPYSETIN
jgi:hypothetical protein